MNHKKKDFRMKTTVSIAAVILFLALIHITCQSPVNPYADPGKARVIVVDASFKAGEVSIFSDQQFSLMFEYPAHIKKMCIESDSGIISPRNNTCIFPDSLQTNPVQCTFYAADTGIFSINLTTIFNDGTQKDTSLSIEAVSPLHQEDIDGKDGDSVTLKTTPVKNRVTYVWELGPSDTVSSDTNQVRVKLNSEMSEEGYLFVKQNNFKSFRTAFQISVQDLQDTTGRDTSETDTTGTDTTGTDTTGTDTTGTDTTGTDTTGTDTTGTDTTTVRIDTTAPVIESITFEGTAIPETLIVEYSPATIIIAAHDPDTAITGVYLNGLEATLDGEVYSVELEPDHSLESLDTVRVVNAVGLEKTETIRVVLNRKPVVISEPSSVFYVDVPGNDSITAVDEDEDSLAYKAIVTHGNDSIDTLTISENGKFSFTPMLSDTGGRATITFSVFDGFEKITPEYVPNVSLRDVPRIDSIMVNGSPLTDTLIVDTNSVSVELYAHDPDTTIKAVYVNGESIEEEDGRYGFILNPSHSFDKKDTIRVVNALDRETKKVIFIIYNKAPEITQMPSGVFYAGEAATSTFSVQDEDEDDLTIDGTITHGDGSTEQLEIADGEFSWIPDSSDTGGGASIRFTVSDGFESIEKVYAPEVRFRHILRFTTTADDIPDTVMVGTEVTFQFNTIVYPETCSVRYQVLAAGNVIASEDGLINWTPQFDGNYNISCLASATNDSTAEFLAPVTIIPMPRPTIKSVTANGDIVTDEWTTPSNELTLTIHTTYNYSEHTLLVNSEPAEAGSDSIFTYTMELDHGPNDIEIDLLSRGTITDTTSLRVTQNRAPVFTEVPDLDTVEADNQLSLPLTAEDFDGDPLTYTVTMDGRPLWPGFGPVSYEDNLLDLNFKENHIGETYTISIRVSDRFTSIDTSITVRVVEFTNIDFSFTEDDIVDSLLFYQDSIDVMLSTESTGPYGNTYWVTRHDAETGVRDTLLPPDTISRFTWFPTAATDTGWNELAFYVRSGNAFDTVKASVYVEPLTVEFLEDTSYALPAQTHYIPVKMSGLSSYTEVEYAVVYDSTTVDPSAYDAGNTSNRRIRFDQATISQAWIYLQNYSNNMLGRKIMLELTVIHEGGVKLGERLRHTIILGEEPQDQPR